MGIIAWRGKYGFVGLIILGLASGVANYFPEALGFLRGAGMIGRFSLLGAFLVTPISFLDLKRFLKEKTIRDTTLFVPVFILPAALLVLGFVFYSFE